MALVLPDKKGKPYLVKRPFDLTHLAHLPLVQRVS